MEKKYQFIKWFPEWNGIFYKRIRHEDRKSLCYIYEWFLGLGFWEIRKWQKTTLVEFINKK